MTVMQPMLSSVLSGEEDSSSISSSSNIVLTNQSAPATKPSKKTRRFARKVKTGCQTCKHVKPWIRRVKCDEGKPHCQRCIKHGVVCDGYENPVKVYPRAQKLQQIQAKALQPKHAPLKILPLDRLNTGAGFEDELSGQCFRIFLEETAKEINGPFPNPIWGRLIPQISEQEPFVRNAIIAIGSLGKAAKQNKIQLHGEFLGPSFRGNDYQHALKWYERSLRGMRAAIASGRQDLQNALIACLLVFIFEGILGNQSAAAIHAESGLNLLFQSATSEDWGKIANTPWQGRNAAGNRRFDDDLMIALTTLDLQVLTFIDRRSNAVHEQIKKMLTIILGTLPSELTSLEDARYFWQLIMNRNYHFLKSLQKLDVDVLQKQLGQEEGSATMQAKELLLSNPKEDSANRSMTQKEEHLIYRIDIGRWTLATANLFDKIAQGENERQKAGAALLLAQTKISHIMLSGTFFETETAYDVFLPEFTAILDMAEKLLPYLMSTHRSVEPRFSIDIGVVPGIFLVASRCRFDDVRRRAIAMLFSCQLREGIWDALAVAHVAKWLRSLEREGLAEGATVPEEKRAVLSAINIDLHNKKAKLAAIQRTKTGDTQRETSIAW